MSIRKTESILREVYNRIKNKNEAIKINKAAFLLGGLTNKIKSNTKKSIICRLKKSIKRFDNFYNFYIIRSIYIGKIIKDIEKYIRVSNNIKSTHSGKLKKQQYNKISKEILEEYKEIKKEVQDSYKREINTSNRAEFVLEIVDKIGVKDISEIRVANKNEAISKNIEYTIVVSTDIINMLYRPVMCLSNVVI